MDLRAMLAQVAATYDSKAGTRTGVPAQDFLRSIGQARLPLPAGFTAQGYGGQSQAAITPWIGIFDPDITDMPRQGLYLAYIFAADLRAVSLTLQQGVERLGSDLGRHGRLREQLRKNARRLRASLMEERLMGWLEPLRLHAPAMWRPLAYEASSIAARRYDTSDLPEEPVLRADLWSAAEILQEAARVDRAHWLTKAPEQLTVEYQNDERHPAALPLPVDDLADFRPKSDADYIATIPGRVQVKTRRHETLIREFGDYVRTRGFRPSTAHHPRDLVLTSPEAEWLVEAKVVQDANPTRAVREAVAQLLEYRHFLCDRSRPPHSLALFTGNIGVYAAYLGTLGIGAAWKTPEGWSGSGLAVTWGIVDESQQA